MAAIVKHNHSRGSLLLFNELKTITLNFRPFITAPLFITLDFDSMQTWKSVELIYPMVTKDYQLKPVKPVLMAEGAYEQGSEYGFEVTPLWIRRQAYYSYLAGAHHTYGHNDSWRVLPTWKQALDAPGAAQMGVLKRIFQDRKEWWHLVPDQTIFAGGGNTSGTVLNLAARHKDGLWIMAYLGAKAAFSIDRSKFAGGNQAGAFWIDPRTGGSVSIGKFPNSGVGEFATPDGWEDALLILESPGGRSAQADTDRGARIHDPSTIIKHKEVYWTFITGRGVSSLHSTDLIHWERGPTVFSSPPEWITDVAPGQRGHFWAPDVIRHDERYLLYYSVSAFGKRTSAIALAVSPVLDPGKASYRWVDEGIVIQTDEKDDYNAIDPGVARGEDGTLWMAFGSFWSGIKLIELDPRTGKRIAPDSPVYSLARKEQIEAAAIDRHNGYYYLFVNWGYCCRGVKSTYSIRVGRSRKITGPYLDKEGIDLLKGGGTLVLDTQGRFIGPGHAGILNEGDKHWMSYHFYDGEERGRSRLAIRPIRWTDDDWPEIAGEPIAPEAAR